MSALGKRKGPPTSNVPSEGGYQSSSFSPRATRPKTGDLGQAGVTRGSRGPTMTRVQMGGQIVESSRPSSTAALNRQLGSVPFTEAVSQHGDPIHQARVTAAWHVRDSRIRRKDFNTDGCLLFISETRGGADALNAAAKGRFSILEQMGNTVPLNAVDAFTPPEINYILGCETVEEGYNGRLPTPAEVMEDFRFVGYQYNQNGGMEVGGTPSPFNGSSKQVNVIIYGDSQGKNYWGDGLQQNDSLYMVVSRAPRTKLTEQRLLDFVLDPVTGSHVAPGQLEQFKMKKELTKSRRRLTDNPCHLSFVRSPNNLPPVVSLGVDDNGFKQEPAFYCLGRYNYTLAPGTSNFSSERASVDAKEMMRSGLINITFVQDHGLQ